MVTPLSWGEEPWSISRKDPLTNELFVGVRASQEAQSVLYIFLRFYQKYLSPLDASRCHYKPSCSTYAYEAIKKYGALLGILMSLDRLMRCHEGQKERPYDPPQIY
ncbi:MAG: membrane protein insertion efficiency factor YidD [Leptospiraceae bacterium]|nr:membrane protein insertion efficiency factor YidD [Leptospiraceae bacterium]MDW8307197.1 membrane protein insertion efficiency factor YidD [Leptospiraceae bacterium]